MYLWKKFNELLITKKLKLGPNAVMDVNGAEVDLTELASLNIGTPGVAEASKALVLNSSKGIATITSATITTLTGTTANVPTVNATNVDAGTAAGTAGTVDVFPGTATTGKVSLTAAVSAGDYTTTIVNASQAGARVYTIPDAGGAAAFVMTAGAQAIGGATTLDGNIMATEAAAGITGGTGTIYKSSVVKVGGIIKTSILIDLTGLGSSITDLDVIGQGGSAAHLGQITAARNGTILTGRVTCLEAPATGVTDIDLYSATESTGVFDSAVEDLTEVALLSAGAAWSAGNVKVLTAWPSADAFLYLTAGAGGTANTYTAGKFLIEFEGY